MERRGRPSVSSMRFAAAARSGAESTSVPSRSISAAFGLADCFIEASMRLFTALILFGFAASAAALPPDDEGRGSPAPGTAQDGSRPADGAIKGGALQPGESAGVPNPSGAPGASRASAARAAARRRPTSSIGGPTRRRRRRRTRARADRLRRPVFQGNPRHADVAVEESLARHAVTRGEVRLGEVAALLVLHRVGVLEALLDLAAAGAAQAAAALERNLALLADRQAQQVAAVGPGDDLAVGEQRDGDSHGGIASGQSLTSSMSMLPKDTSCFNSARASSSEPKRGRNLEGTMFTGPASSTMRTRAPS